MVEDIRTALTGRLMQLAATIVLLGAVAGGGRALALFWTLPADREVPGGMNVTTAVYMHVASYANPDHEEPDRTSPTRKR